MCEFSDLINSFKENQVPLIFDELASESLHVMRSEKTQGDGGGQITGAAAAVNVTPVKCQVSVRNREEKDEKSGKIVSITSYKITFPVTFEVLPSDRLKVLENGNQPERIFKIIGLPIVNGLYKAKCELEQ